MKVMIDLDTGKPERGHDLEYLECLIKDMFELTEYLLDGGEKAMQYARSVTLVNQGLFYGFADLAEQEGRRSIEEERSRVQKQLRKAQEDYGREPSSRTKSYIEALEWFLGNEGVVGEE